MHSLFTVYIHLCTYVCACIDKIINLANCPKEVGFNQIELQELRDLFLAVPRRFQFQGDEWSNAKSQDYSLHMKCIYMYVYIFFFLHVRVCILMVLVYIFFLTSTVHMYIFPRDMWFHHTAWMHHVCVYTYMYTCFCMIWDLIKVSECKNLHLYMHTCFRMICHFTIVYAFFGIIGEVKKVSECMYIYIYTYIDKLIRLYAFTGSICCCWSGKHRHIHIWMRKVCKSSKVFLDMVGEPMIKVSPKAENFNGDLCGCKPTGYQKDPMRNVGEENSSVFTAEVAARPTCITFEELWKLINSSMAWRGKEGSEAECRQNLARMSWSIPNMMNVWLMSMPLYIHMCFIYIYIYIYIKTPREWEREGDRERERERERKKEKERKKERGRERERGRLFWQHVRICWTCSSGLQSFNPLR